jgi:5-methylcytosine-specific restriction endonuclease McrA
MGEGYRARLVGSANPNYRGLSKKCEQCGGAVTSRNKSRRFCSLACYHASPAFAENQARNQPLAMKGIGPRFSLTRFDARTKRTHPKRVSATKVVRVCEVCGLPFKGNANRTRTCSELCWRRYHAERQRGEKSHRWQGGKTSAAMILRNSVDYGLWRSEVFRRDDFRCQLCSQRGGRLTAHHIQPFSTHPELVLAPANGITLCWPCHTSIRHKEARFEAQFTEILRVRTA